jgi:hypothetical protein
VEEEVEEEVEEVTSFPYSLIARDSSIIVAGVEGVR